MLTQIHDEKKTRRWLEENCHRADIRHTLVRAVEYFEAVERAGLAPDITSGDDLYAFLADPAASAARTHSFVVPTL